MSNRHQLTIHLSEGMPALNIDVLEEEWQKLSARLWAVAVPNPSRLLAATPTAPSRRSRKSVELVAPVVAPPATALAPDNMSFITLQTVDGRYVMLRPPFVQGVRSSTDGFGPPDPMDLYDGPTKILMRGDKSAWEVFPPEDPQLGDMVMALEHGPDVVPWITLEVEDGDDLILNAQSVVYVVAATSRVLAAFEQIMEDSDG